MEQDEKKKKLSTDDMLNILKQSKPKPITLDDILNPQKTPKKQEPLIIEHKHRPVVIPILDNEDENLCENEKSPIHNMLIEAFQSEISPSPGALRPGSRKALLEEQPSKEIVILEENKKPDFIDETYSPAVNEPSVKAKPAVENKIEVKEEPSVKIKPSGESKIEVKEEPSIKAKPAVIKGNRIDLKEEPSVKAKPAVIKGNRIDLKEEHSVKEKLPVIKKVITSDTDKLPSLPAKEKYKIPEIAGLKEKMENFTEDAGKKGSSEENSKEGILPGKGEILEQYFHYNLGIKLTHRGQYRLAIEEYKKVLNIDSNFAEAYNNMANLMALTGNKEDALENYKKALKLDENNVNIHQNIALVLYEKHKFQEAIEYLNKARELEPGNIYILSDMGSILSEENRLYEAMDCFQEALLIEPDNPVLNYNLAFTYQKQGETKKAGEIYKKVLELDPYN